MNKKRSVQFLLLILCILLSVTGVYAGGSKEAVDDGVVTLNVSQEQDPESLDPLQNWVRVLPANLFVTLVGYDYDINDVYPRGAVSWTTSADGYTWTFKIRENWNWSDGKSVTANDYEYAFKAIVNPDTASVHAWRLYIIKNAKAIHNGEMAVDAMGVKALDDYTLQIELNAKASWFLPSLSSIGHAAPEWVREKYGEDWTKPENIVVNGPYTLTEWKPDNLFVLEKNSSYYDADKVQIEKINLYTIPATTTSVAMYENGELDQTIIPPEDIDRIMKDPVFGDQYQKIPMLRVYFYRFNANKAPFDNVDLRKALAAAIDKKAIVDYITKGGEQVAHTVTPPGSVGHVPDSENIGIPFNASMAKKYLADAGYPGGTGFPENVILGYNANDINAKIAQAIQKMWKDNLGINLTLQAHEGGGYGPLFQSGAFNIFRAGWGMDYPDANNIHAELFHSSLGWPIFPAQGDYDALITKAGIELDMNKRKEIYKQAEKMLVEELVTVIPLYYQTLNLLISPSLERTSNPSFWDEYWLWKKNK